MPDSTEHNDFSIEILEAPLPPIPNRPGILAIAGPAALGNLLMSLVGIINIKMVGTLGTEAIAAVATGSRIFFIFQAFFMAVNAGTTALVARHWGAGNYEKAASVLYVAVIINTIFAIICSLFLYSFSADLVKFFGLDETTTRLAGNYLSIFGLFAIGFALNLSFGAALRATGNSLSPLYLGVIANIATVGITYLLIFGAWGFTPMGIVGSAIGGGSGFLLATLIFLILWQCNLFNIKRQNSFSIDRTAVRQLFQIGYPAGIEQIVLQCGFLSFLWVVAFYGTEAFAAYGIGVTILSFSFVIGVGFSIAGATLVGQNLGAGDIKAAKASGWKAMRLSLIVMTSLGGVIILFARPLASFLVNDEVVIQHTVTFIYVLGAVQPLMAIDFAIGGALRGAGDTRFPLISSLAALLFVRIGLSMFFLYLELSIIWIYSALIFDYILKTILLTHRFHSEKWVTAFKH
jgi:putative MATE family efflux protein